MQEQVKGIAGLVNGNPAIRRRGRWFSDRFLFGCGDDEYVFTIRDGEIAAIEGPALLMPSWTFALRASESAWAEFWKPVPKPGYHDLIALVRVGELRMEGDIRKLMAYLAYIKMVLESPRSATGGH